MTTSTFGGMMGTIFGAGTSIASAVGKTGETATSGIDAIHSYAKRWAKEAKVHNAVAERLVEQKAINYGAGMQADLQVQVDALKKANTVWGNAYDSCLKDWTDFVKSV